MVSMILLETAASTTEFGIEGLITQVVMWLKLGVETAGTIIIAIGALNAVYLLIPVLFSPQTQSYSLIRLRLSRFLALALEFQLAADILGTAISPSWSQIGKLAAIAVIRTSLNYFLQREMKEAEKDCEPISAPAPREVKVESS